MKKTVALLVSVLCALSFASTACDSIGTNPCETTAEYYLSLVETQKGELTDDQYATIKERFITKCKNGDEGTDPMSEEEMACVQSEIFVSDAEDCLPFGVDGCDIAADNFVELLSEDKPMTPSEITEYIFGATSMCYNGGEKDGEEVPPWTETQIWCIIDAESLAEIESCLSE